MTSLLNLQCLPETWLQSTWLFSAWIKGKTVVSQGWLWSALWRQGRTKVVWGIVLLSRGVYIVFWCGYVYILSERCLYCSKICIMYYYYWLLLYSAILCSRANSLTHFVFGSAWVTVSCFFFNMFFNIHWHGAETLIAQFGCYMAGAMWNCCNLHACSVYTIQPCTSL